MPMSSNKVRNGPPLASSDFAPWLSVGAIRLQIGFALAKKGGIGGGWQAYSRHACTWRLSWVAVEWSWSALVVSSGAKGTTGGLNTPIH